MCPRRRRRNSGQAPNRLPSSCFFNDCDKTLTSAPNAWANLTPRWPSPPKPTTATLEPGPTPERRSGEYVVIPAHSRGAASARSMSSGILHDEVLGGDNVAGVAALGDLLVTPDRCVCQNAPFDAVLLSPVTAVHTRSARVDHAAHPHAVTDRMLGDRPTDGSDDTGDLDRPGTIG